MKAGTKVKATKVAGVNNGTIHEGYWVIGDLSFDLEGGRPISILRGVRAGVEVVGWFSTSPVESLAIDGNLATAKTRNSTWQIEVISDG